MRDSIDWHKLGLAGRKLPSQSNDYEWGFGSLSRTRALDLDTIFIKNNKVLLSRTSKVSITHLP